MSDEILAIAAAALARNERPPSLVRVHCVCKDCGEESMQGPFSSLCYELFGEANANMKCANPACGQGSTKMICVGVAVTGLWPHHSLMKEGK